MNAHKREILLATMRGKIKHTNPFVVNWNTWTLVFVIAVVARAAIAGGSPESVAVVVNADSWASKTIANEYIRWREIPASNIIYLSGLPGFQTMDVEPFREKILMPVLQTLYQRGVLAHIDCITYSADLPTAINVKSDVSGQKLAKYQTTVGAINGLTYLYQLVLARRPEYLRLDINYYMRQPLPSIASIPKRPEDVATMQDSVQLIMNKQWESARKVLQPLADRLKDNTQIQFGLARCLAQLGHKDEAIDALTRAVQAGWADRKQTENTPEFSTLRDSVNFKALLSKMDQNRSRPFEVQATRAFSSQAMWNMRGDIVETRGLKYMLSTVLAVTSGRGNSVNEALRSLRRSIKADAAQPRGTVYFMKNSDVRARTREPGFVSAVKALEGTRLAGAILSGTLPERKDDVAGAMIGTAGFNWPSSHSTILPGAICEHLTSFGGALLETNGQTPITEFIRYGAAGTSGTVTEPYSIQAKFPFPFIHVHYARGCSLAEAFYQSVFGPYQLLIIGDPLCQPWAKPLDVEFSHLKANQHVAGTITIQPKITGPAAAEATLDHYELYIDGRRGAFPPKVRSITIDTKSLSDGWHELSLVAIAKGPLATRGRCVLPVIVDNGIGAVSLALVDGLQQPISYGDEVAVVAKSPVRAKLAITSNGQKVGEVEGPEGTLRFNSRLLGIGPVRLQAITLLEGKPVYSKPIDLQIEPPAKLKANKVVSASELAPGIALTVGTKKLGIIESTRDAKWLASKSPQTGQTLWLDAFFTVPQDDLYQFQFRGNAINELIIDGHSLWKADDSAAGAEHWTMIPLQLEQGWHRFRLKGRVAETPNLDIRFGGHGCKTLDGTRFKHRK